MVAFGKLKSFGFEAFKFQFLELEKFQLIGQSPTWWMTARFIYFLTNSFGK